MFDVDFAFTACTHSRPNGDKYYNKILTSLMVTPSRKGSVLDLFSVSRIQSARMTMLPTQRFTIGSNLSVTVNSPQRRKPKKATTHTVSNNKFLVPVRKKMQTFCRMSKVTGCRSFGCRLRVRFTLFRMAME